jgi:putative cell wall-binding protein
MNFPDALSISPVSAVKGMPIILVNGALTTEQKEVLNKIKPSNIYITGSTGVISSAIENELKNYSSKVVRLGGANRYETSTAINNKFKTDLNGANAILAFGGNFPDALSGTALAYKNNAPIVLVDPNNTTAQKEFVSKNSKTNIFVLGGTGVISEEVLNKITK